MKISDENNFHVLAFMIASSLRSSLNLKVQKGKGKRKITLICISMRSFWDACVVLINIEYRKID